MSHYLFTREHSVLYIHLKHESLINTYPNQVSKSVQSHQQFRSEIESFNCLQSNHSIPCISPLYANPYIEIRSDFVADVGFPTEPVSSTFAKYSSGVNLNAV